jgi:hypothetical protein
MTPIDTPTSAAPARVPLTMPTEAREPQGDDRAEREMASAVHPDEVHAGVRALPVLAEGARACAVDVPALQRQRPVSGPSVGSVSGPQVPELGGGRCPMSLLAPFIPGRRVLA